MPRRLPDDTAELPAQDAAAIDSFIRSLGYDPADYIRTGSSPPPGIAIAQAAITDEHRQRATDRLLFGPLARVSSIVMDNGDIVVVSYEVRRTTSRVLASGTVEHSTETIDETDL